MNLAYTIRRAARSFADRTAVIHDNGAVTYRELYERALRGANMMLGLGLRPGDRAAILLSNRQEYLELLWAMNRIGVVAVPMNTRLGADEAAFWLNDSAARVLFCDERTTASVSGFRGRLQTVEHVIEVSAEYEQRLAAAAATQPDVPEPNGDALAGLYYTSGTTGGPKGVMLTHENLYANAIHMMAIMRAESWWRYLHAAPMFHLADGAFTYFVSMAGGAHAFLPSFDPEGVLRVIERHRLTVVVLVPTMLNMVLKHPAIDKYDTSSLRHIAYGASPMPLDVLQKGIAWFGPIFWQAYGMTEASPVATIADPDDHDLATAGERWGPIRSAGRPVPGCEVRIVDLQGRDAAPYESGEIVLRGDNVMRGYWNRPDVTAQTLRDGWYHSGDIGALDSAGRLFVLDRLKDMVKTGGENVHSPEVESVIFDHPDVLEASVIGVPDERWGEAIKAIVVRRPESAVSEADLIAFCRARLTHFKCPSSIEFVETLPKGATGKVLKNKLREPYWRGRERGVN